jgi:hypothetical protein
MAGVDGSFGLNMGVSLAVPQLSRVFTTFSATAGISTGQALKAMEEVAAKTLPQGYAGEWTDTAFQEKRAEGKTAMILGFAVYRHLGDPATLRLFPGHSGTAAARRSATGASARERLEQRRAARCSIAQTAHITMAETPAVDRGPP